MSHAIPPRSAIRRMPAELGLREGRERFLRLDYNENTAGCSHTVRAAIARVSAAGVAMYPQFEATRKDLARFFGVRPAELALTNGADEALRLVFDAFVERGDKVLLADPTFTMYRVYAVLFAARVRARRYDPEMRFPLRDVLRELRHAPRVLFLANPNNPTGTLLSRREIAQVLRAARRTLVVLDEAYFDFSGVTVLPWIRRYPNLVVIRTFSKASGMAGLRLGCMMANARLSALLRRAQPPFPVNTLALAAARAAVRDRAGIRRFVREVAAARAETQTALTRLGVRWWPSAGNFLLADLGPRAGRILRSLERRGILLRDRSRDFGRAGPVRITVGTRPQMRRVIRVLERLLPWKAG